MYSQFFEESKYLKSHIYDRIAEKLTELYKSEGELPRLVDVWSWRGDTSNLYPRDYYRFIEYDEERHAFFFAGWFGDSDETAYKSFAYSSPIEFNRGVREVWSRLSESDKTEFMATVLGAKNG